MVLAAEVGGRWSNEAAQFLGELAAFKASAAPEIFRERVRGSWLRRWRNTLSCSAAKAFVLSLLDFHIGAVGDVEAGPIVEEERQACVRIWTNNCDA